MTTRAAINILGSTGELIDVTSLGIDIVTTKHPSSGKYLVFGTLGMAPPPLGWGYVVNQMDLGAVVAISYADQVLTVTVTVDGQPADLQHSITLHVEVEELELPPVFIPPVVEPPVVDPLVAAKAELAARNAKAVTQIARIQDRVDTLGYGIDAGEATEEDEAEQAALLLNLKAWKAYKFALGKVTAKATWPANPEWPVEPVTPVIAADPMARATQAL